MKETDPVNESAPSGEQWTEAMADAPEFNNGDRTEGREDLREQEVIVDADVDFVEALSKALPQVGEDGKVNYYLCGSVAMDLLPRVSKIDTFHQKGKDTEPESQGTIELPDSARAEFLKGVRKKGHDIDIVRVSGRTANTVLTQTVLDQCKNPESVNLLSEEKHESTIFAFDSVGENQMQGDYYYSKATLDDGEVILIPSPGALIGAKAYEVANYRLQKPMRADGYAIQLYKLDTPEKIEEYNQEQAERHAKGIEKRYKDLKTMIAGFAEVMSREQIIEAAKTAIMHRLEADDEDYQAHEGGMPLEYGVRQLEDIITECLQMMPEDNE